MTQGVKPGSCEVGSRGLGASFPAPLPQELGAVLGLLYSGEVLAGEAASPTAQAPGLFHYFIKVHYAGAETSNKP